MMETVEPKERGESVHPLTTDEGKRKSLISSPYPLHSLFALLRLATYHGL